MNEEVNMFNRINLESFVRMDLQCMRRTKESYQRISKKMKRGEKFGEINKDIDRYQESVAMGLTAKQLIFFIASVVIGGGLVYLLYPFIGLTGSSIYCYPGCSTDCTRWILFL